MPTIKATPTPPTFTHLGRIVAERTDHIQRQQAIENALSAALWHVRRSDSHEATQAATGRAIRAVAMLKQSCADGRAE